MEEGRSGKAFRMHAYSLWALGRTDEQIRCLEWGVSYFGDIGPDMQRQLDEARNALSVLDADNSLTCSHCKDYFTVATLKCGGCLITRYCSRECQKKSWPAHKKDCGKQKELNKSDERDKVVLRLKVVIANRFIEREVFSRVQKVADMLRTFQEKMGTQNICVLLVYVRCS